MILDDSRASVQMAPIYIRFAWCYIGAIGVMKQRNDFAGFVAGFGQDKEASRILRDGPS